MSRLDTVRTATGRAARRRTKDAKARFGDVAADVRGATSRYACGASRRAGALGGRVGPAIDGARERVVPRIEAAAENLGPRLGAAFETARDRVRDDVLPKVSKTVNDEVIPRVSTAWEASEPAREEAKVRGTLALAALKGELNPPTARRSRRKGRLVALLAVFATIGGAVAFWRSQTRRQEWLLGEADEESARGADADATSNDGSAGGLSWETTKTEFGKPATPADGVYAPEPESESEVKARRQRGEKGDGANPS